MKETLNRISKHEGVIGYMLFKISGGKMGIEYVEIQNLSANFIAGIPIKTTLSHELTNQYGYLATSIIKEVIHFDNLSRLLISFIARLLPCLNEIDREMS